MTAEVPIALIISNDNNDIGSLSRSPHTTLIKNEIKKKPNRSTALPFPTHITAKSRPENSHALYTATNHLLLTLKITFPDLWSPPRNLENSAKLFFEAVLIKPKHPDHHSLWLLALSKTSYGISLYCNFDSMRNTLVDP